MACLGFREGTALGPWLEGVLRRLSQGPYLGTLVVAYWVLGSHNPYGFRARDVLKTEKVWRLEICEAEWAARHGGCGRCLCHEICSGASLIFLSWLSDVQVDLREVSELILETERVRWAAMGSGGWGLGKGLPLYSVKPDHRLAKVVDALQVRGMSGWHDLSEVERR
jgi:hypothetical protein